MVCYYPIHGFIRQDYLTGKRKFVTWQRQDRGNRYSYYDQTVPCGSCIGCRLRRSRDWAVRCMHEASLYSSNCFLTLTYAPEFLPPGGNLVYRHFQEFMKRLRFHCSGVDIISTPEGDIKPIRFYVAGEYGTEGRRPHFHACIFNFDFFDKKYLFTSPSGSRLYTSPFLQTLWPFGFSSIGDVNFRSAGYAARYIMKKITGDMAEDHYVSYDAYTGEVIKLVPEFNKMSLKPGIGKWWLDKYKTDVFPNDYVVVNGSKVKPPRFYDNLYKVSDPFGWEGVEYERFIYSQNCAKDNTEERLIVKEAVTLSNVSRLGRKL